MVKLLKITAVLLGLALTSACASPDKMAKMAELERQVQRALDAAGAAGEKADRALSVASEASYSADQAQATAESALRCCNENSDKIERAFERVTRK